MNDRTSDDIARQLREEAELLSGHCEPASPSMAAFTRIGDLEKENQALRADLKTHQNLNLWYKAECEKFHGLLRDIQATCGHPDAAEACRIILNRIKVALVEK